MTEITVVSGHTYEVVGSGQEAQAKLDAATNTYGSGRGVRFRLESGKGSVRINPGKWVAIVDPADNEE